jgi:hypothetical protein
MPYCIVLFFHLNLNFKFKFKCISFSPSLSLLARPTPSSFFPSLHFFPQGPTQQPFLFFLSTVRPSRPNPLLPSPTDASLSFPSSLSLTRGTHLSGPSSSSSQARTRAGVRPRHGLLPCGALGPHVEAPQPPYKAAAPCPRSRQPVPAALASQNPKPRKSAATTPRSLSPSPHRRFSVAASHRRSSALG